MPFNKIAWDEALTELLQDNVRSKLPKVKTNDLKKGDWIVLANGWLAEVRDNKKGNTRVCDVYGFEHEAGSVYSHDIVAKVGVVRDVNKIDVPIYTETYAIIEHTKAQTKMREYVTGAAAIFSEKPLGAA